ncbi:MAG: peptide chain release factor N(5)-glutamine methyltransferase [Holosporaceae bacterium]|jgi:release factor glutamine methyltransferase|nr:peptide chain release factor N(5)-glutamine methyltransferase [Holosporaceae bacterium]
MKDVMNVEVLLKKHANASNIRDIRRMIAHLKGISYENVFFHGDELFISPEEYDHFLGMLSRYEKNEPVSKIIQKKFFWKHEFFVNENVLDPRPETELIIEAVLQHFNPDDPLRFLDLGTGSGCILLSLLYEFKKSTGLGIDISEKALEVAVCNRQALGIDGATFQKANWNDPWDIELASLDVIVSNPPYIKNRDMALLDENVRKYDPLEALDGGNNGLDAYVRIAATSPEFMKKNGMIFLEIGCDQADDVTHLLSINGYENISTLKDLQMLDRVVCGSRR